MPRLPPLPDTAVCLHCGYSLCGLPDDVCPECGGGFDPDDPFTYLVPGDGWTARTRRLARGPSALELIGIVFGSGLVLMQLSLVPISWTSLVGEGFLHGVRSMGPVSTALLLFLFCPLVSWSVLALACAAGWVKRVRTIRDFQQRGFAIGPPRLTSPRWLALPICIALVAPAMVYPWPFAARFAVSRPFIHRTVSEARVSGRPVTNRPGGLFRIQRATILDDGRIKVVTVTRVRFVSSQNWHSPVCGFVWDPSRPNPPPGNYGLRLSRYWYIRDWR